MTATREPLLTEESAIPTADVSPPSKISVFSASAKKNLNGCCARVSNFCGSLFTRKQRPVALFDDLDELQMAEMPGHEIP